MPDASLTDAAGAEPLAVTTGLRSDQVHVFTATLGETAILAAPDAATSSSSSAAAIDLDVLAEAQRVTVQNQRGGPDAPQVSPALRG